jgi:hypothetical protein
MAADMEARPSYIQLKQHGQQQLNRALTDEEKCLITDFLLPNSSLNSRALAGAGAGGGGGGHRRFGSYRSGSGGGSMSSVDSDHNAWVAPASINLPTDDIGDEIPSPMRESLGVVYSSHAESGFTKEKLKLNYLKGQTGRFCFDKVSK